MPLTSKRFLSRLLPALSLCVFALMLMWRPVLRGEVFLPLDALMHLHPWRYSYERVPVNNPINTAAKAAINTAPAPTSFPTFANG